MSETNKTDNKVTIKGENFTLICDNSSPVLSKSGKNLVIFSTRGNVVADMEGKEVKVGINVFTKK